MPFQSDKNLFNKRLANSGFTLEEFNTLLAVQNGKCAYCGVKSNAHDMIINNSYGCTKLVCYECDVLGSLDASDVPSFNAITSIIRGLRHK